MTRYAAHLILAVRFRDGRQDRFPCYENVVLLEAETDDEAMTMAEEYGKEDARDLDDDFRWGDRPAYWEFVGVRKLIECREAEPGFPDDPVLSRTELTYSRMELASEEDLRKLAGGEPVAVTYEE